MKLYNFKQEINMESKFNLNYLSTMLILIRPHLLFLF